LYRGYPGSSKFGGKDFWFRHNGKGEGGRWASSETWQFGIALGHSPLDIKGTPHRIHHAAELSQHPVTGVLDNPPTVLGDLGIDEGAQMVLELGVRPFFIQASQPTVSSHIGRQDGGEPSLSFGGQGSLRHGWRQSTPLPARARCLSGKTASAMNHQFELGRAGIVLVSSVAPPAFCGMTTSWNHINRSRFPAPQRP
jgi:hypothetical protein